MEEFADAHCDVRDARFAVSLCVTEACSNIVRHAYPEGGGDISLVARIDDDHLVVEIADHGVGPDGAGASAGLGVGLAIMRRLADARISSDEHGTRVELRFPCRRQGGC